MNVLSELEDAQEQIEQAMRCYENNDYARARRWMAKARRGLEKSSASAHTDQMAKEAREVIDGKQD